MSGAAVVSRIRVPIPLLNMGSGTRLPPQSKQMESSLVEVYGIARAMLIEDHRRPTSNGKVYSMFDRDVISEYLKSKRIDIHEFSWFYYLAMEPRPAGGTDVLDICAHEYTSKSIKAVCLSPRLVLDQCTRALPTPS